MLKRHRNFFIQALFIFDWLVLAACWRAAFYLRFHFPPILSRFPPPHTPRLEKYVPLLFAILVIWALAFRLFRIYRPRRGLPYLAEMADILKAFTVAFMTLVLINFFLMPTAWSRVWLAIFYSLGLTSLSACHLLFRKTLRMARRRGYNLRHLLVAGDGPTALEVARTLESNPEVGYRVAGLLTADPQKVGTRVGGYPVIGTYAETREVVRERDLDEVIIALPWSDHQHLAGILESMGDELANIHFVPDFAHVGSLRVNAEMFDGIPFITFRTSPLFGWGGVVKRAFDLGVGLVALTLCAVPMMVIALLIKLTSRGPVFYRQERMGLDGRRFLMLKFRSMREDAERETGPVWTKKDDERCTWIGRLVRRVSLDELPQLFNVLKGDMSLVGPRPERPVFVEQFRKTVPRYMLRHKIKAGITGWAQVNGWRGDTSLEERIRHDIHYIEHWSFWFDLRILLMTLWRGFAGPNAY